ncbi:MAG: PAS domain S-box protein [Thermodesulfobacteriota bacterium]|nr:PAS domain S-box protein [Thermodesulfobacteriota bacterium]
MSIASDLDILDPSKEGDHQVIYDVLARQYKALLVEHEKLLATMEGIKAFDIWSSKKNPDCVCIVIPSGKVVFENKQFIKLIKETEKEIYWCKHGDTKPGLLKEQIIRTVKKLEETFIFPFKKEFFRDPTLDGGVNRVEALFEPYTHNKKRYICVILQDTTTHTLQERKRDDLSVNFINPPHEDVFILDNDHRINYASNSFLQKEGMALEEIIGRYCYEVTAWKLNRCCTSEFQCIVRQVHDTGEPVRMVRRSVGKDGSLKCTDVIAIPIHDNKGNIFQVMWALRDVSEFMATHDALLTSEKKYQTLIEQLPVIVYTMTLEEKPIISFISPQVESVFGISADDIIANPNLRMKIIHPVDRGRFIKEFLNCRKQGKAIKCEYRLMKSDGDILWVHDRATLICDEKGQPQYFLGMITDINDHKKMEERIRLLSSRLWNVQEEEKSRIARDLHDGLGQSLAAILYSLEGLAELFPKDMQREEQIIKEVIDSIQKVSTDVRCIASDLRPSMLDTLGLVPTLRSMAMYISEKHDIRVDFQAMGMEQKKLPSNLEINLFRLFQETINNIIKHAKAKRVNLKLIHRYPKIITIISDDGRGFDFNSILRDNNRMGIIGMRQRVSALGGEFNIKSEVGKGTTVRAEIPLNLGEIYEGN